MKKRSSANRRSASRAKFVAAALCLGLGWGGASLVPDSSTLGENWRFRIESFALFSWNDSTCDAAGPRSRLDASGRRVVLDAPDGVRFDVPSAFVDESAELWASAVSPEAEPVGATFDEAEPSLTPVSFANADAASTVDGSWLGVDQYEQERARWSNELRLEPFPEPTFAEHSAPAWRDAVAVEPATAAELRALDFEPGVVPSALVSSTLSRRSSRALLPSGDYSFAETSNASDANASEPPVVSTPAPATAPARVGAFTACGPFESNGVAKLRVQ